MNDNVLRQTFMEEPTPVTFADYRGDRTFVTIVTNIKKVDNVIDSEDTGDYWEGDVHAFWEATDKLDKEAIEASPESFMAYVPTVLKQKAKDEAQGILDAVRDSAHPVKVPSYKEGYAVMHRAKDDINLLAGLMMGGLPYYEFADGQVVAPLTTDDIKLIYKDVAAHEVFLQQRKQKCWDDIDAATSESELATLLAEYRDELNNH